MSTTKKMRMTKGETKIVTYVVRDINGVPVNLTGATAYCHITADLKVAPLITLSSPGSGIVIDPDQTTYPGKMVMTISSSATASLVALGEADPYFYDVWIIDATGAKLVVVDTSELPLYPNVKTPAP